MTEEDKFDLDKALDDWDAAFDRETRRPAAPVSDRPTSPPNLDSDALLGSAAKDESSPFGQQERARGQEASRLAEELLGSKDSERRSENPFAEMATDEVFPGTRSHKEDDATVAFSTEGERTTSAPAAMMPEEEVGVSLKQPPIPGVDRNLSFDDDVTKIANVELTQELIHASSDVLGPDDADDLFSLEIDEENFAEVDSPSPANKVEVESGTPSEEASRAPSDSEPLVESIDVQSQVGENSATAEPEVGVTKTQDTDGALADLTSAFGNDDEFPEFDIGEAVELGEGSREFADSEDSDEDFPEFEVGAAEDSDEDFPEFEVGVASARLGAASFSLAPPRARLRTSPLLDSLDDAESVSDSTSGKVEVEGGASTAKRSVTRRKPRREVFSLVGRDAESQAAQVALLKALADTTEAPDLRGALLQSAAEHAMQLGDVEEARALLSESDDLIALRMRRRDAMAAGDFSSAEALLERELALPLSKLDEAASASTLAELRLTRLSDLDGAEAMAQRAYDAHQSYENALALFGVRYTRGDALGAASVIRQLMSGDVEEAPLTDGLDAATLMAALIYERADETDGALFLYRKLRSSRYQLVALLALERLGHGSFRDDVAAFVSAQAPMAQAPNEAAEPVESPPIIEVLRRLVASKELVAGDASSALFNTEDGARTSTARLRGKAAFLAGDQGARSTSLEALAASSGGRERALALVDLAETRAALGDIDGAEKALRDASLADSELGTIDVVREILARRIGDPDRFTRAVTAQGEEVGQGAVEAAAKWVSMRVSDSKNPNNDAQKLRREGELLERALAEAVAPLTADTLLLDVHNEAQSDEALEYLRHHAERSEGKARVSALLALAAREDDPAPVFEELRGLMPGAPLVSRTVARFFRSSDPLLSAQVSLDEADTATSDRSTYAAVKAARTFLEAGERERAVDAAQQAFLIAPGEGPAAWVLKGDFGDALEGDELAVFLEELGDASIDARLAAQSHVLAALSSTEGSSGQVFEQANFERASDFVPEDALLALQTLTGREATAGARENALDTLIEVFPSEVRTLSLLAGVALEAQGEAGVASKRYEALFEAEPSVLVERLLDRAELAAGKLPSIAARRLGLVRQTRGTNASLAALESLAAIDLHERDNPRAAYLTLQTIRDASFAHLPTLRAIERYTMNQGTAEALRYSSEDMLRALEVEHAGEGASEDQLLYLRTTTQALQFDPEATTHASDMLLGEFEGLRNAPNLPAEQQRWLAGELLLADSLDDDVRGRALPEVTSRMTPEALAATYFLHEDVARAAEEPAAIATLLRDTEGRGHEYLSRFRGDLLSDAGAFEDAGLAYARAAQLAYTDALKIELHGAAASAFQKSGTGDREKAALEAIAALDVTHGDVFERLEAIFRRDGDEAKLAELVDRRIEAGTDEAAMLALVGKQAELRVSGGDTAGAKAALAQVLRFDPKDQQALRQLAELYIADEEWKKAASTLVRFARLTEDRPSLQWVFRELGTIYDKHEPDAERAEAAYRRAIRLDPDDTPTIEAIADFYERQENWEGALKAYQGLFTREIDPDAKIQHVLSGSRVLEKSGDSRRAERTLVQQLRQNHHSLALIKALAELYRRQNAGPALAMHLSRSTVELAKTAKRSPSDPAAWHALMEVLTWRGHGDSVSMVASAALANGIDGVPRDSLDEFGGARGLGRAVLRKDVLERLAPDPLSPATFDVFRQTAHVVDAVIPVDLDEWGAVPLPERFAELHADAHQIAGWFNQRQVQLLETEMLPRTFVPLSLNPLRILIGREMAEGNVREENRFLLIRAIAIASAHLACTVRIPPEQLNLFLTALVRQITPDYLGGGDPAQVAHAERAVTRHVPILTREALRPAIHEMSGSRDFSAVGLTDATMRFGDRIALLATGNVFLAVQAILRMNGQDTSRNLKARQEALKQDKEASQLIEDAIFPRHLELRRELGRSR